MVRERAQGVSWGGGGGGGNGEKREILYKREGLTQMASFFYFFNG